AAGSEWILRYSRARRMRSASSRIGRSMISRGGPVSAGAGAASPGAACAAATVPSPAAGAVSPAAAGAVSPPAVGAVSPAAAGTVSPPARSARGGAAVWPRRSHPQALAALIATAAAIAACSDPPRPAAGADPAGADPARADLWIAGDVHLGATGTLAIPVSVDGAPGIINF